MGRQERLAGPTSRWPSSHTYSMREFTLKSVEMSVELGGCSGLPHVVGPAAKINFITDTVSFATALASVFLVWQIEFHALVHQRNVLQFSKSIICGNERVAGPFKVY